MSKVAGWKFRAQRSTVVTQSYNTEQIDTLHIVHIGLNAKKKEMILLLFGRYCHF